MLDQMNPRRVDLDTMPTLAALGGVAAPALHLALTAPGPAHFALEDHDGYPIECPLCGEADRWRLERDLERRRPRAFVCIHIAPAEDGGIVRRVASVSADQVGGYLDLTTLIAPAA
jgi:hypothetical protein